MFSMPIKHGIELNRGRVGGIYGEQSQKHRKRDRKREGTRGIVKYSIRYTPHTPSDNSLVSDPTSPAKHSASNPKSGRKSLLELSGLIP